MKNDSLVLLGAVVGSMLVIVLIGLGLSYAPNLLAQPIPTPTPGGLIVGNVHPARDFTLTDQDGHQMNLSNLRGKAVLIFFGYTHCPDICPLNMSEFKQVKKLLQEQSPQVVDRTAFVMISVDGDRDTPGVMKQYLLNFDPTFIGLTGSPDLVSNIGLDYGVKVEIQKPINSQTGYLVAHTSFSYLIDPQGNWRLAYPFQTPPDLIARDMLNELASQ